MARRNGLSTCVVLRCQPRLTGVDCLCCLWLFDCCSVGCFSRMLLACEIKGWILNYHCIDQVDSLLAVCSEMYCAFIFMLIAVWVCSVDALLVLLCLGTWTCSCNVFVRGHNGIYCVCVGKWKIGMSCASTAILGRSLSKKWEKKEK